MSSKLTYPDLLCCPECGGDLLMNVFVGTKQMPIQGLLWCRGCESNYPIVDGIPRMIANALKNHPEFCEKYSNKINKISQADLPQKFKATQNAYSNWWTKVVGKEFYQEDIGAWVKARTGRPVNFFEGRTILDAGCGNGRITYALAQAKAKLVIGMDLGFGVLKAKEHCKNMNNVWIVQGNLFKPPLREKSVDSVLSIGVLHHTPIPSMGFNALANLVIAAGTLSIYLYPRTMPKYNEVIRTSFRWLLEGLIQEPFRRVISKMPHSVIIKFCQFLWIKRSITEGIRPVFKACAMILERIPPRDAYNPYENKQSNIIRNYDYYCTPYNSFHGLEEVINWFSVNGFGKLLITPHRLSVTGWKSKSVEGECIDIIYQDEGQWKDIEPDSSNRFHSGNGPNLDRD